MKLKSTFILLFIIGLSYGVQSQSIKPINGFRSLDWGTSIDNASLSDVPDPSFAEVKRQGDIRILKLPNDTHQLGTASLEEIYYFFHRKAGFFKVLIKGIADDNGEMDAILINRLDDEYQEIVNESNTHWVWSMNDVKVDYKEFFSLDWELEISSNVVQEYYNKTNQQITDF